MTSTFHWGDCTKRKSQIKGQFTSYHDPKLKALMPNITTSEYFKSCFPFQKKTYSLGNFYSYLNLKGLQDWTENFT